MMRDAAIRLSDRELLRRLVAFDTTSSRSNLSLVDAVADYLDRPGIRLHRIPSELGDKATLVALAGPGLDAEPVAGDVRPGLTLSGHTDVVPPGDGWTSDPFTLTERDGRLVARGACDMKGFLALAINAFLTAAGTAARTSGSLRAPLALVLTYDEEIGTLGARHFVTTWPHAAALPTRVVIGEPTSLRPIRLHKGHLRFRLTIGGRSAHSGYPHLGINAIEAMGRAILALTDLRATLAEERVPMSAMFPDVPYVPLNIGRVDGGVAVNVVPERATLEFGIRLLPGMASAPIVARVRALMVEHLTREAPDATVELAVVSESPPLGTDADADHYRMLLESCAPADAAETGVSFATDAGWLQTAGLSCVIWGPGSIEVAHRPDEYLPLDQFARARGVVEAMIDRYCAPGVVP